MKRLVSVALAGGLLFGALGPATAGKPKVVMEDAAGDADVNQGLGQSIPAGFDIVSGSINRAGKDLEFSVTHADMPPIGSFPEGARFLWNFMVGTEPFRLTVKSADIGKPDPLTQSGAERVGKVDAMGHFRVEGECETVATVALNAVNCPVVGYVEGVFDAATMSFTVTIPMDMIGAKPGSKIIGGPDNICPVCWVSHAAERSLDATIIDGAVQTVAYKVPK